MGKRIKITDQLRKDLKSVRIKLGLSREAMGQVFGIPKDWMGRIERGLTPTADPKLLENLEKFVVKNQDIISIDSEDMSKRIGKLDKRLGKIESLLEEISAKMGVEAKPVKKNPKVTK